MCWTKEEKIEYHKQYYENNKEKINEYNKKWYENNKEKIKKKRNGVFKKYHKENHMKLTINKWKKRGLLVDDEDEYESIYYLVQSTENCELCNCILTDTKPQISTSRCMDHDHITGKFRNVVCRSCNAILPTQKE